MMKTITLNLIITFAFFLSIELGAQGINNFSKSKSENSVFSSKHSDILSSPAKGKYDKNAINKAHWGVAFSHLGIQHGSDFPTTKKDSIKRQKTLVKQDLEKTKKSKFKSNDTKDNSLRTPISIVPKVELDFKGNAFNGLTPLDNNIAVSDEGNIVSVVNSSILFVDNNGNSINETSFSSFFSALEMTGVFFDPRVIYDPTEDKFILVALNGTSSSNSTIVVAFSSTSNPNDEWWLYTLEGNPLNNFSWLDFPNIGISKSELYISGNSFSGNSFRRPLIYQINKENGFTGGNINWMYWTDIMDVNGANPFTMVPISYGFDGSIGPEMYFISSRASGGNELMLFRITDEISNDPTMIVNSIPVPAYGISGDGLQLGSNNLMDTNDARIQSGFYADETIHFTMNSDRSNGYSGIYYGRIDLPTLTSTADIFGVNNFDYAYSSIAPFTTSPTDKTVLIGFLRTSSAIYPEFRVVACNSDYKWSSSILVKEGSGYVDYTSSIKERWGDYTGISRRHLADEVEVWVAGCYGANIDNEYSNVLSSWIGKISSESIEETPLSDFDADVTNITAGQQISFTDLSSNNPSIWSWSFSGGSPNSSTEQNPIITYNNAGTYDVSLKVANSAGNDSIAKEGFITVTSNPSPPIVNFSANHTDITEGQQINYTDLSQHTPIDWLWSFPGGSPSSSTLQNPTIIYNESGFYDVTLVASNQAGSDTLTKEEYLFVDVVNSTNDNYSSAVNDFKIFPNPSLATGRISAQFEISESMELDFFILDNQGRVMKHLLRHWVKQGKNVVSFNGGMLSSGNYYLIIQDKRRQILKNGKIIII